jgi:hypothetical protein
MEGSNRKAVLQPPPANYQGHPGGNGPVASSWGMSLEFGKVSREARVNLFPFFPSICFLSIGFDLI